MFLEGKNIQFYHVSWPELQQIYIKSLVLILLTGLRLKLHKKTSDSSLLNRILISLHLHKDFSPWGLFKYLKAHIIFCMALISSGLCAKGSCDSKYKSLIFSQCCVSNGHSPLKY